MLLICFKKASLLLIGSFLYLKIYFIFQNSTILYKFSQESRLTPIATFESSWCFFSLHLMLFFILNFTIFLNRSQTDRNFWVTLSFYWYWRKIWKMNAWFSTLLLCMNFRLLFFFADRKHLIDELFLLYFQSPPRPSISSQFDAKSNACDQIRTFVIFEEKFRSEFLFHTKFWPWTNKNSLPFVGGRKKIERKMTNFYQLSRKSLKSGAKNSIKNSAWKFFYWQKNLIGLVPIFNDIQSLELKAMKEIEKVSFVGWKAKIWHLRSLEKWW